MKNLTIRQSTKSGHDSKLYNTINQITEDLREKGYDDKSIEKFLISFIKETIKEV
jgi:microsomal dipeptidase-like Zn-dependent dipeptidase